MDEHVIIPKALVQPPRKPFWKRALLATGQAFFYAIVILLVASVISRATGQASLAERVDRNAQVSKDNVRALLCILSVPPNGRTVHDTEFCIEHTGINTESIPLPPSLRRPE